MQMISGNRQTDLLVRFGPPTEVANVALFDSTLVVAPHPDDESLGAGGAIALLRDAGMAVHVLFVSDGSQSHPNSPTYPAPRLRDLRESEALDALTILGVSPDQTTFLRLPDTQVPTPGDAPFDDAVQTIANLIQRINPATVLVPWRRDPHRDHRATWRLIHNAVLRLNNPPRMLEYPIWLWELGRDDDQPRTNEVTIFRLAIDTVVPRKKQAIAAHRSQVSRLIDDDPTAFYLSPELLAHFDVPHELFFAPI